MPAALEVLGDAANCLVKLAQDGSRFGREIMGREAAPEAEGESRPLVWVYAPPARMSQKREVKEGWVSHWRKKKRSENSQ